MGYMNDYMKKLLSPDTPITGDTLMAMYTLAHNAAHSSCRGVGCWLCTEQQDVCAAIVDAARTQPSQFWELLARKLGYLKRSLAGTNHKASVAPHILAAVQAAYRELNSRRLAFCALVCTKHMPQDVASHVAMLSIRDC